jgi:acetyltransferase
MFAPESIAVIGATEAPGSVGRALLKNQAYLHGTEAQVEQIHQSFGQQLSLLNNLLQAGSLKSYRGPIYPVNLKRDRVLGLRAFPKIGAVPNRVNLAIIATPAATVPDVVQECAEAGVTGAMIISAGFKECGPLGAKLEEAIVARRGQMRIVGPNCLGVMIPRLRLNATFAPRLAKDGDLAFCRRGYQAPLRLTTSGLLRKRIRRGSPCTWYDDIAEDWRATRTWGYRRRQQAMAKVFRSVGYRQFATPT